MGDVIVGWMFLWRETTASLKQEDKPKIKDITFYEGQIKSAEFFISSILPITAGKVNAILEGNDAVITISEESFGG